MKIVMNKQKSTNLRKTTKLGAFNSIYQYQIESKINQFLTYLEEDLNKDIRIECLKTETNSFDAKKINAYLFYRESDKEQISEKEEDTTSSNDDELRNNILNCIGDILTWAGDSEDEAIKQFHDHPNFSNSSNILALIALDTKESINVRATAARLFIAKHATIKDGDAANAINVLELADHNSPLIRLGVVLGFADIKDWAMVESFANKDKDSTVRETAKELLGED